jgi:hypothetical protein
MLTSELLVPLVRVEPSLKKRVFHRDTDDIHAEF